MQAPSSLNPSRVAAFPAKPLKREFMFGNRTDAMNCQRLAEELKTTLKCPERELLIAALRKKHPPDLPRLSISQRNVLRVLLACNSYSMLEQFFAL